MAARYAVTIFLAALVLCSWFDASQSRDSTRFRRLSYRRRHVAPRCNTEFNEAESYGTLESKVREADVVFTGKVTSEVVAGQQEGGPRFLVRVKRVLKGDDSRTLEISAPPPPQEGCPRPVRVHHTAVFLAKKVPSQPLQLITNPLPLTLRTLDKVNAAVKDMSYKPRPPIVEEACEKTFCEFSADCVTRSDGTATCECPSACPSTHNPVCGNDGVTYGNRCMLRRRACQQRREIRVRFSGECGHHQQINHRG